MLLRGFIIAMLLLAFAGLSFAEPLEEAYNAYLAGDSDKALDMLAAFVPGDDTQKAARAELLKGAVFATRYFERGDAGDRNRAEEHFATALNIEPFIEPAEGEFPMRVIGLFRVKRLEILPGERVQGSAVAGEAEDAFMQAKEGTVKSLVQAYFTPRTLRKAPVPETLQKYIYSTPEQFITVARTIKTETAAQGVRTTVETIINVDSIANIASKNGIILDKIKQPSLLISIDETVGNAENSRTRIVENYLVDYFTRLGFNIFDKKQLARIGKQEEEEQKVRGNPDYGRIMAEQFGVDILLVGTASGSAHEAEAFGARFMTGEASVEAKLLWSETGKDIRAENVRRTVRAEGEGEIGAAKKALQKAGEDLAATLATYCITNWNDAQVNGREVQFLVTNIIFEEIRPLVDQMRIISEARRTSEPNFQSGEGEKGYTKFFLQSKLSAGDIAKKIEQGVLGFNVKVQSVEIARIELDLR